MDYQRIKINHGYATVIGPGNPPKELIDALNNVADIAYKHYEKDIKNKDAYVQSTLFLWKENNPPKEEKSERKMDITMVTIDNKLYKRVNNLYFYPETTYEVCELLNRLYLSQERIIIEDGDKETGEVWENNLGSSGRIGRTTGTIKMPILIKTKRSLGGEIISTHRILYIRDAKTKKLIYNYKMDKNEI